MKCISPMGTSKVANGSRFMTSYGCGQCRSCRINKRRQWTYRILLEMRTHPYNYFVTFTYSNDNLPLKSTLVKTDLQLFWKRLRKRLPFKIRYFAVGEYGEKTHRPHYHSIIFSSTEIDPDLFDKCWGLGYVSPFLIPGLNDGRKIAGYCASYTLKKLNNVEKVKELFGEERIPEFSVCSRRPGIGLSAAVSIGEGLKKKKIDPRDFGNNMHQIRLDGKKYPIDRVLKNKVLDYLGGDPRSELEKALRHENQIIQDIRNNVVIDIDEIIAQSDKIYEGFKKGRSEYV